MEQLTTALILQAALYPGMKPADAVKLAYQNEFGGGHLLNGKSGKDAEASLREEYEAVPPEPGPLTEPLGNGVFRVYLSRWKRTGRPLAELFRAFLASAETHAGDGSRFVEKLRLLEKLTERGFLPFSPEELDAFLREYRERGFPVLSHSDAFRRLYRPAYRVVSGEWAERWMPQPSGLQERVYALLRTIPPGKVTTYGAIAFALGNPGLARAVGNCLHRNPDPVGTPCFRVVDRQGRASARFGFGGRRTQEKLLLASGVELRNGRADLSVCGAKPGTGKSSEL